MNKILLALTSLAALASCTTSYNIQGTSNVSDLDGNMLFLKTVKNGELANIDSCDVVHGQFHFSGSTDSTRMAFIFMDDESIMPVVLEKGDVSIQLNNTKQSMSGTELNDKLFKFVEKFNTLQNQYVDLSHKESQAIMNGDDMQEVYKQLTAEMERIQVDMDKLVTGTIADNFDNVLGSGVFMIATSGDLYPEFRPWIEDILSKATDNFKNDPYVKNYIEIATRNRNIQNGMETPTPQAQAPMQLNGGAAEMKGQAPTPSEMAKPQE